MLQRIEVKMHGTFYKSVVNKYENISKTCMDNNGFYDCLITFCSSFL